jgi:curved DNA-binding protein CbpA
MNAALAFEILGITPGATEQEIRAAYKHVMKHIHPDRGIKTEYFSKEVNAAREALLK